MSSRLHAVAAGLAGIFMVSSAQAQVESSALGDVDPWGANFLERGERGLDEGLWTNSDPEYLLALLERVDVSLLSPSEKTLLSRALRSPAAPPEGDLADELQNRRLELLYALGERKAAASLAGQLDEPPESVNPDIILSDNRLARGEADIVCAQMKTSGEGRFWSELRAICALKAEEPDSAELSIEIAGQQEGAEPWFTEVAFAMLAEAGDRPAARYGSGLEMTLSQMAGLEPDSESLTATRPDLAAIIAADTERPIRLRLAAAAIAAEAGHMSSAAHRRLYEALIEEEDFQPETATEAAFVVLAKEIEAEALPEAPVGDAPAGPMDLRAMTSGWTEPVEPEDLETSEEDTGEVDEISVAEEQALAVREALREAATDPVSFAVASRLFGQALGTIPASEDTSQGAIAFAAAALSNGSRDVAMKWLDSLAEDSQDDATRFEAALLEGYALLLADQRSSAVVERIVVTLLETGYERAQIRDSLQLFSVWAGMDIPLPVIARSALAQSSLEARPIEPGIQLAFETAQRAGASGEALLTILTQTDGQVESLSGAGLARILKTLDRMGAGEDARALAFDAAQLWTFAAQ